MRILPAVLTLSRLSDVKISALMDVLFWVYQRIEVMTTL